MGRVGRLTVPKIDFPVRGRVDTSLPSTDPLSPSAGESVKQLNPRSAQTSDFEEPAVDDRRSTTDRPHRHADRRQCSGWFSFIGLCICGTCLQVTRTILRTISLKMNDAGLAGRAGGISSATVCVPCRLTSSWTRRNLPEGNKRQFMTRQPAINERSKSQNDSAIYKLNKGRKRKCNRTTPGSRRSSHLNAKSNGKQTVGLVSPMTNGSAFTFHNLGPLGPMTPHAEQTNAHGAL